jgi:rhodanese-related sulfurtransferase
VAGDESVPEIDVEELDRRLTAGARLIDVRQPDEFAHFRVPGATSIPLGEIPDRLDEIPRDETVYLICGGGGRSGRVAAFLNAQGFDTVNVAGGSRGWVESGRPYEQGS